MTQRNHFVLLDTETKGEKELKEAYNKLARRVYNMETIIIGLVDLFGEHGIEAPEFDPDKENV